MSDPAMAALAHTLRANAREYLAWAIDDLAHGRRDRAARFFKEWKRQLDDARWYGAHAVMLKKGA